MENKGMTVGELRKALEGVADDVEVTIFLPDKIRSREDYMRLTKSATYRGQSAISSPEFEITAGEGFGY
jgi:hypothetical protein